MAEYRYYLIPDAMTRAFPEKFEKQTPTEFFDNIADLEKRYHQLREMPYNNERTWNERARFPYARLVVGVDRQNPDGAVAIIQVRNGVNYLCDDYRGPYADGNDAQIPKMAKKLVEVIGVDRVRPHTYTQRDGYTWVQVEKDMHITEWLYAHTTEILNALFEVASTVTVGISDYVGSGEVNTTVDIENAIAVLPGGIGNMPVALELMVVGWMLRIVNIVVNTIVAARFIELYVYNAMASLSIATLCYQELHGIAVNFLKSYLAVALQGAVLYLVIGFYPALAGSLGTGGSITEQAWAMLGQSVILLVAVFMSGKFTKAITNAMT